MLTFKKKSHFLFCASLEKLRMKTSSPQYNEETEGGMEGGGGLLGA
jgi:hypothetical protein